MKSAISTPKRAIKPAAGSPVARKKKISVGKIGDDCPIRCAKRDAIVSAAAKLFAREGYADCEMEQVAAKTRIAKGTLYLYFAGKQDLFFACVDAAMRELGRVIEESRSGIANPFDQISSAVRAYLKFFAAHPHYVELLIQERAVFRNRKKSTYFEHRERNRGYWRDLYARLIAEGRLRSDLPVEEILDAIGNMIYGTMFTNHFYKRKTDIDEQHRTLMTIFMQGILSPSERRKR